MELASKAVPVHAGNLPEQFAAASNKLHAANALRNYRPQRVGLSAGFTLYILRRINTC
jgi:hypothetical protein